MADDGFNGSTISFYSGNQIPLIDLDYSEGGAEVDVTGCADARKTYEAGIPDETVTYTIVGTSSNTVGDEGAIAIVWNDGATDNTGANAVITNVTTSGGIDGPITSAITARATGA